MRRGLRVTAAVFGSLSLLIGWVAAQPAANKAAPAPRAETPATPIATVGTRKVFREEFEARARAALEQYRQRTGNEVPVELQPVVRRQVLEGLIRREILVLEATRRGDLGTVAEADAQVRKDPFFNPGGKFDAARYEGVKANTPALYQNAITQMREQLGARKLNDRLEGEMGMPEAEARLRAERALTRATVDFLPLRRAEFSGAYPEPREREILDWYRAHADDYRRPERAVLSVVYVNVPALPESLQSDAARVRDWELRMKALADSALSAVRAGAALDEVASPFGGIHGNVVVMRDNFPGFWQADARVSASLFSQKPGTVLPEPVKGRPGWLLVRVDEVRTAHVAPLREVAREIRTRLRTEARQNFEERELRALYAKVSGEIRTRGYRVRYAAVDTTRLAVPDPSASDLDRYYRAHIADYSSFDPRSGSIKARPFADVEGDIRTRWRLDRRSELMRATADGIERSWRAGRRDRGLESRATLLREVGPVTVGAQVDTGLAGRTLSDSLASRGGLGVGAGRYPQGMLVWHVWQEVPNFTPNYEQAVPELRRRRDAARDADDERGARALFDRDASQFRSGNVVHFTRVALQYPELKDVPLTREEVEAYHRRHIDRYMAPEEIRARHVLIEVAPGVRSDSAAKVLATELLRRIRAGEDFATIASQYSDDTPTRGKGGDLGQFGHGAMRESFEKAAFALKEGEVSDLVRSDLGYHIIKLVDRLPAVAQPLETMWINVGADAAREKSEAMVTKRADSLFRSVKTPAQLVAAVKRMGGEVQAQTHVVGDHVGLPELRPLLIRLDTLKPGEIYDGTVTLKGHGIATAFVDSITPPVNPSWEEARERVIAAYRAGAGERALEMKRAELDSLAGGGWSLDSLGTMFGGLTTFTQSARGQALPGLGGGAVLDSLLFGRENAAPVLREGEVSGWLAFPPGFARIRFTRREVPAEAALKAHAETTRRTEMERKMIAYFEGLRARYSVAILDPKLREVDLPKPPPPTP